MTVTTTTASTALTTSTQTLNVEATETTTATVTSTFVTTSVPTLTTTVTPTTTLTPEAVTSTPVSTATQTEVKTVHVGQAAVQLASPTPITPVNSNGLASSSYDDTTGWRISNIPFDVGLYGVTSRTLIIGINGWVSPGTRDSGAYVNQPLPNSAAGDPSWVAYWADLFITSGTQQGIYYQIDGDEGHRTLSIEFFMSFFGSPTFDQPMDPD
ncbi:3-oxo-5a-steroid 4- dehydrogenase [Kalmusia sp. IMI 367209]|nr:3-oxo-5a-steroid 4- dehydrogenase [Kalmusia sp. IMI 367209]